MNERIRQLAEQAGFVFWEMSGDIDWRPLAANDRDRIREHFGVEL